MVERSTCSIRLPKSVDWLGSCLAGGWIPRRARQDSAQAPGSRERGHTEGGDLTLDLAIGATRRSSHRAGCPPT